ncbi:hypothetical protein EV383_5335 [Pseudonocardia sediminis]|uniref:Uncharacterized protein n=1 Tax=Pseudonocardia sediminis TaxID=1397368 RepID=A0A4Q7V219_PSEST|nr:hypothetical protein [Pseudonocardia sediminis]RZT88396.1 hypothetical protein EV383_5335 [Pseudonocardia sediminis]
MTRSLAADEYTALCGSTVVTVSALMALGVPRSTIAHRCRAGGPWMWLMPSVVKLNNAPPTRADRRRAALLHAGDGALITGLDALDLLGMNRMPAPSGPVHLLVPSTSRRTGHGTSLLERTDRLPPAGAGRWPLAPPVRAVLDTCRRLHLRDQVRATLAEAVQTGRCGVPALAAELEAGSQRGSALPRQVLTEISAGARSAAEAAVVELLRTGRFPEPMRNAWLYRPDGTFLACVDVWFADVGLAWEIDSREFHLSPDDHERTLDRHNALVAAGVPVLRSLPSHVSTRRSEVLARLRDARAECARRPLPAVIASPHRRH